MRLITAAATLLAASPVLARNARPAPLRRFEDPLVEFPAHNFSIPVDHFHNDSLYEPHSNASFNNRYWFDASHYKPGGPVIMLQAGEASGTDRVPILQNGIIQQLAQLTNGIAVVMEHRYYGTSFPVANLTTENLRFLTVEQAMGDWAYFAQNIVFPGYEDLNVTSPGTPYLAYGGSYAGAFVAFLRYTYPDLFYGAISSSGEFNSGTIEVSLQPTTNTPLQASQQLFTISGSITSQSESTVHLSVLILMSNLSISSIISLRAAIILQL